MALCYIHISVGSALLVLLYRAMREPPRENEQWVQAHVFLFYNLIIIRIEPLLNEIITMKTQILRTILVVIVTCLFCPCFLQAKGDQPLKYDLNATGVSAPGMTLVKVSVYVDKPKNATVELLKKAAVHGIIFRGVSEADVTGFTNQGALVSAPGAAQQHGDYFATFFQSGGQYLSYANMVESTTETVKVNKKEYRVSAIINVSTDQLRKTLQAAGIIRKMTDGF